MSGGAVAEVLAFLVAHGLDALACLGPLVEAGFVSTDKLRAMTNEQVKSTLPASHQRKFMAALRKERGGSGGGGGGGGGSKRKAAAPLPPESDSAPALEPRLQPRLPEGAAQPDADADVVLINRSPVMILWGATVARELGHDWDAALSLSSMMAGLTARAKGRSLGLGHAEEAMGSAPAGWEATSVSLLGRDLAAASKGGATRGLDARGAVILPSAVYRSLSRAFGDRLAVVYGEMQRLAAAAGAQELRAGLAYSLYCRFRPEIPAGRAGWGAKGRLSLRQLSDLAEERGAAPVAPEAGSSPGERLLEILPPGTSLTAAELAAGLGWSAPATAAALASLQEDARIFEDASGRFQQL